jgi:hypothetical protein
VRARAAAAAQRHAEIALGSTASRHGAVGRAANAASSAEVAVEALREIRAKRDIPSPPSPATASDPRIAQTAESG